MAFGAQGEEDEQEAKRVEQSKLLNQAAGFMRSQLAKGLSLRVIPQLRFHYDAIIESGSKVSALIDKAISEDNDKHESDAQED